MKRKKQIWKDSRFYFILFLTIITIALIVQLFLIPILPMTYIFIIVAILILIWFAMYKLLYSKRVNKTNQILGRIMVVIICFTLGLGNFYIFKGGQTLNAITGANIKTDAISVIVLTDNKATKIEDLSTIKFGRIELQDKENTEKTISDINTKVKSEIQTSMFVDTNSMVQALYDGKVDAIIMNEAYRGLLEDKFPKFDTETKVVYQFAIKTEVNDISKDVNVTKTPFNVFISGIDTYGPIGSASRSDVNMIASVNPTTHQILLISIPRDFYVAQTCQGNQLDKLTHAGIFGVDCSVASLEKFLNIEINYYARVNFSSLIKIVDSLNGINVDNPVAFTSNEGYFYDAGTITLDGERALAYSRDRDHQEGGDRGRGKNQMRVITGIINKAISPTIITNYNSVMNAIAGSFETNMSSSEVTKFIQKQLDSMSGWNIAQYSLDGTGGTDWTPANGFNAYVMYPDQSTVNEAITLLNKIKNGENVSN